MTYGKTSPGMPRTSPTTRPPAQLSEEDLERINDLVRDLRQRLQRDTPDEVTQEVKTVVAPARSGFARVIGRAFRRS